jgi:hypothetical protein
MVQAHALCCSPIVVMNDATKHLPPAYYPLSGTNLLHHWALLLETFTPIPLANSFWEPLSRRYRC